MLSSLKLPWTPQQVLGPPWLLVRTLGALLFIYLTKNLDQMSRHMINWT